MIYSVSEIICDWLDVTFHPDSRVFGSDYVAGTLTSWLLSIGADCQRKDSSSALFEVGNRGGKVKFDSNSRFVRVSASGSALAHFRALDIFEEYLSELSSEPHRVTRLDAALDVHRDGADVIKEMRSRFPDGIASLGRKALGVAYMTGIRPDGLESGTCYLGHRQRARQTARVYDKAKEAYDLRKEIMPPMTRYEVTARGERDRPSPTLKDAFQPTSLFWHIASPTLLKAPEGVLPWVSGDGETWVMKRRELLPAEVVARKVEFNPHLDAIAEIASLDGPDGLRRMIRLIANKYHVEL